MHNLSNIKPLVSVIMPTYNRAHCIDRAVKSVVEQSLLNWELIIIDNNSIDDTVEIIRNFKDSRISIYQIDNQGIVAKSRNYGINLSSGNYIAFLDSDDWWAPSKLEITLSTLESGADLVYHDLFKISKWPIIENKHLRVKTRVMNSPVFDDLLTNGNAIVNSSVVVRASILRKVNGFSEEIDLFGSEDFDGWLRIAMFTENFARLEGVLGYYWDGGGNATSANTVLSNNLFLNHKYRIELKRLLGKNLPGWMSYSLARASLKLNQFEEAKKYSFLALKANSRFEIRLKALVTWVMSMIKYKS